MILLLGFTSLPATFSPFSRLTCFVVLLHAAIDHFKLALDAGGSVSPLGRLVLFGNHVSYFFRLLLAGLLVNAILMRGKKREMKEKQISN